jgi:hypothetical protein
LEINMRSRSNPKRIQPQFTTNSRSVSAEPVVFPDRQRIAGLASEYWAARGFAEGGAEEDWFRAEQELKKGLTASASAATKS